MSLLSKQKILRPKNAHCCSVCVCFSLKYFKKRTVIRIVMCCVCVCVCLCEHTVPFYKTNSTIEHITLSFRCFSSSASFLAFCFIVHTGLFFFPRLSRILFAKKAMHLSLFFSLSLFCLLLLFWFDDDYVYGMHSLICFSLICDR